MIGSTYSSKEDKLTQVDSYSSTTAYAPRSARLTVVYKLITELKPGAKNPRRHSKEQIQRIADAIRAFGFRVPILIDRFGNVIAGHGRLLAAKLLGMTEVPVICIEDLSEAQLRGFQLADNRLAEMSEWDDGLLADALKELAELNLDFSIEATGFTAGEIDFRIMGSPSNGSADDPADVIPACNGAIRVTKQGDFWLLGKHRVLCADARFEQSFSDLVDGKQATMVFTDPPYNVPIDGHCTSKGAIKHSEFPMASGEMTEVEYSSFLKPVLQNVYQVTVDGATAYIFIDWRHSELLIRIGKHVFSELKNVCVWVKDRAGMGSFYRSQHEFVCVFKKGTAPHINNFELGQHGRYRSNVWNYPCPVSFGTSRDEGELLRLHPTVKPVALVADAIMDVSKRNDIVLDPFLGSGTTLIAAERTGRICYGLELDPQYVDLTIRRWQTLTGKTAHHAASDRSFDELETEATHVG
jgi:DNA modification methylase